MKKPGERFRALPEAARQGYEARSFLESQKREDDRQEALVEARAASTLQRGRSVVEDGARRPQLLLSTYGLTESEEAKLAATSGSGAFVEQMRQGSLAAPGMASEQARKTLDTFPVWSPLDRRR